MPRKKRKFVGSTWKEAFLYDAEHYGYDATLPDEYIPHPTWARAWFRDGPTAASMVVFSPDGVTATHATSPVPSSTRWLEYVLVLPKDEFLELVREYMKVFPRPFKPTGQQLASLAYEMVIQYVAVGPPPRSYRWFDQSEMPTHLRLFLERSS